MKHNFLKKLTALLLGTIMVFSMIPAIAIGTKAAETTETLSIFGSTGSLANKVITWTSDNFTFKNAQSSSTTAIRVSDSDHYRIYGKSIVTIEALNGKKISNIVFTATASGNYATVLNTSINNNGDSNITVKVNGKEVTVAFTETVDSFSFTLSAQTRITQVKVTLVDSCAHENTEAIGTPSDATCTEPGITAGVKCSDCGEVLTAQEPIEATGHTDENGDSKCDTCGENLCTEHVWVDGEVIAEGDCTTDRVVAQVCEKCGEPGEDKVTTAPGHTPVVDKAKDATCTETGLTEGSHCDVCDEVITKQETVPMLDHNYVEGICTACGAEKPVFPTFEKVTSTLDDFSGTYLIVYEAGKVAFDGSLGTLDVASNTVGVTISDGVITGDLNANVFYIEKTSNGYTIKSAFGMYIGSTAFSNQLLTAKTYYNTISIDADGNAVITAESNTTLRYNDVSGQYRFRYYKSGQQPIALYKLVEAVPEPEYKGFGLTLDKGITVRAKFDISAKWIEGHPNAKIKFSNGTVCELKSSVNYYTTTLTPGQIGSDLTVSLVDGDEVIITKTVSVSTYIEKAKAAYATDTKLCTLLDAIDAYSKAAAKVEQSLTAPDFNAIADHVVTDKAVITGFTNVVLAEYATIGLNINAEDGYTFVASRGTASTGKLALADNLDNGVLYIENIRPANFDDVITVTIYDGDTVVSSIDFTFNSYLKLLANDENMDDLDRNIVIAAYNYGVAASAYVGA